MGVWTNFEFNRNSLPKRCYLFAGDKSKEEKECILSLYTDIEYQKHTVYERFIVSDGSNQDLLIFQVYGAPTISDLTFILKDGGVEEIIFIGTAYGIGKGIAIGDYIIPDKVQALDGLLKVVFDVDYSEPNKDINAIIKNALDTNKEKYYEGKTVSVPSTFFHPSKTKFDEDVIALEMEFSSVCHISKMLNMKCGGVFIVSDNEDHTLLEDRTVVNRRWLSIFKMIKGLN